MPDLMTNYGPFENGVAIRGMTVAQAHSGNVYWVHHSGSNANRGTYDRPVASIDTAIGLCTANAGDIIMVKAGHAESVIAAAGIDADIAGISIIGLGRGTDMPEVTISTATTADIDIDAANITIRGIRFICAIDSMAAGIDVNSTDFTLEDCEFYESSATGLVWVDINGGAANACDRARIRNNRFVCTTAANWDAAIELGEVAAHVEIASNDIVGDFDDACVHNPTGKVLTHLLVRGNYMRQDQTGDHAMELVSACTGAMIGNTFVTDSDLTVVDQGSLTATDNWFANLGSADVAATPYPAASDGGYNPRFGTRVTKSSTLASDPDDLFTVTGKCLITLMVGEVTSVVATSTSMSINTSTNSIVLVASTDIVGDGAGVLYIVSGDPDDGLNGQASGADNNADAARIRTGFHAPILVNDDRIYMNLDGAGTGLVQWDLYYVPLEAGASITSSA